MMLRRALLAGLAFGTLGSIAAFAEPKLVVTLGAVKRNVAKLTPEGDGSDYAINSGVCLYRANKASACGYVVEAEPAEVQVRLTHGSNRFVAGEKLRLVPIPRFSKPVTFGADLAPPPAPAPAPSAAAPAPRAAQAVPPQTQYLPPMAASEPRTTASEKVEGVAPSQMERGHFKPNAMLQGSAGFQYGKTYFMAVMPGVSIKFGTQVMFGPKGFLSFYPDFTALGGMLTLEYYFTEAPDGFFVGFGGGVAQLTGKSAAISETEMGFIAQAQFGYVLRLTEILGFRLAVGPLYLGKTRTASLDLNLQALNAQGEVGLILFF